MDFVNFLNNLGIIIDEIEKKVQNIENDTNAGIASMSELIQKINTVLPDWFYFIDQTGIGEKQVIGEILNDILMAMEDKDKVLLEDALLFGMQSLMLQYKNVIEEALNG